MGKVILFLASNSFKEVKKDEQSKALRLNHPGDPDYPAGQRQCSFGVYSFTLSTVSTQEVVKVAI